MGKIYFYTIIYIFSNVDVVNIYFYFLFKYSEKNKRVNRSNKLVTIEPDVQEKTIQRNIADKTG